MHPATACRQSDSEPIQVHSEIACDSCKYGLLNITKRACFWEFMIFRQNLPRTLQFDQWDCGKNLFLKSGSKNKSLKI